jgi:ATP-dependent Clp protease adaptor protein ClpS
LGQASFQLAFGSRKERQSDIGRSSHLGLQARMQADDDDGGGRGRSTAVITRTRTKTKKPSLYRVLI